jgi:hypothetical protein
VCRLKLHHCEHQRRIPQCVIRASSGGLDSHTVRTTVSITATAKGRMLSVNHHGGIMWRSSAPTSANDPVTPKALLCWQCINSSPPCSVFVKATTGPNSGKCDPRTVHYGSTDGLQEGHILALAKTMPPCRSVRAPSNQPGLLVVVHMHMDAIIMLTWQR